MYLLGCFFMLLLMAVFWFIGIGLSILTFILRFFGINYPRSRNQNKPSQPEQPKQKKKRYADDEGEYVDFEEV